MKSMVSYYFCDKYGESQTAYLDIKNYTVTRRNNNDVQRLIKSLQNPSRSQVTTVISLTIQNSMGMYRYGLQQML